MSQVSTNLWLEPDGTLVVKREQDCEAVIENNKQLSREQQDRKAVWRHTASIPAIVIEQWLNDEWKRGNTLIKWSSPEFDALIQKKLKDPDWKWLRVDQ